MRGLGSIRFLQVTTLHDMIQSVVEIVFVAASNNRQDCCSIFCDHAVVLKPHGSLDWYRKETEPVRCTFPIDAPRLIITPGLNKFRGGYDQPFDAHRESANKEIDNAQRF